jgi:hypothetical protein
MFDDERAIWFSRLSEDACERSAHIEMATTIFLPPIYGMSFIDKETIGSGAETLWRPSGASRAKPYRLRTKMRIR